MKQKTPQQEEVCKVMENVGKQVVETASSTIDYLLVKGVEALFLFRNF